MRAGQRQWVTAERGDIYHLEEEYKRKKEKGKKNVEKDTEVINSHLAADAVKKRDSNPIDSRSNSRGMQDNYHNARKHVGWSKGQLFWAPKTPKPQNPKTPRG